ncbi:MAG: ABC transporter permease [Hydrogenibacillus sp.]|nr:ABC transporter permease [Hydrogenibacillus sp.]
MNGDRLRRFAAEALGIVVAFALAIAVGMVLVLLLSAEPGHALYALLIQPLTSAFYFGNVLERAIPLIFAGLSVAVSFQARQFNIGAEGAIYIGALFGTLIALYATFLPGPVHQLAVFIAAIIGGALVGWLPGWLKARFGANEVVSTLMLNTIAIKFTSYLLSDPIRDKSSGYTQTVTLPDQVLLARILPPSRLHTGLFIALLAVVVTYGFLYRTTIGYEIRMVGINPRFAAYGGIDHRRAIVLAFVVSGILAGLGGIVEVVGIHQKLIENFSPGYGFDGLLVAIIARLHPLAVPFAAFFYAYLRAGAAIMERESDIPQEMVSVIQVILILFITAEALMSFFRKRMNRRTEHAR